MTPPAPGARGDGPPERLRQLAGVEARLALLDLRILRGEWALYTGRGPSSGAGVERERSRFLRSSQLQWVLAGPPPWAGARTRRRWELLAREITDARTEQAPEVLAVRQRLQRALIRFRPRWEGRAAGRAEVREVLRSDPRARHRKAAFYAEDPLFRSLEGDVRRLITLRNERAREEGLGPYAALRLGFEGLRAETLEAWIDEILHAAVRPIRDFREEFLEREDRSSWFPWDVLYGRELEGSLPPRAFPAGTGVECIVAALRRWGFPPSRLRFRVVRHDLPFGGLTFAIRVPSDVRVLVHPRGGWESYLVLFHEFGHAVHAASIRQPTHLLRNGQGFAAFHEGIADVFESLAFEPSWLATRPGLTHEQIARFRHGRRLESLLRAASTALAVRLELAAYRHPDRIPWKESHRSVRRLYGFGEYAAPSWVNALLVTHPIYHQSYLLSVLIRKQILEAVRTRFGEPLWPNPRVGPWLTDFWLRQGARTDWLELVREVTGRPLGTRAFLESVRRGEP